MKRVFLVAVGLLFVNINLKAQVPQGFSYQAVVRDAQGSIVQNQNVAFRFSILENSATGTVVYSETHQATTNNFGLVVLSVGEGTVESGNFSTIQWGSAPHFLKVELDITGGNNFTEMGTTQLLSVPYALHAHTVDSMQTFTAGNGISITGNVIENTAPDQVVTITGQGATTVSGTYPNFTISSTDNNTTYTAGTGIDITGNVIENTAPDQVVTITGQGATTVSGTYPNFTISSTDSNTTYTAGSGISINGNVIENTAPDQVVNITGQGATTVSGTYPNFVISSTDSNTTYTAGTGLTLSGDTLNSVWTQSGNNIYNNNTGRVGIGISAPTGKMTIQGDTSNILFEVKDKNGDPVFVVYQDSVHVFVNASSAKANKGAFAVNAKGQAKANPTTYLRVTPDSSRIYTENSSAGFGVRDLSGGSATSYMQLTPENYFIGHDAGKNITSGLYNLFLGYEAGKNDTSGTDNVFIGYQSGFNNLNGDSNCFIGYRTGYSNLNGWNNCFIGNYAGYSNTTGIRNVAMGMYALYNNSTGNDNTATGFMALYSNTSGQYNTATGYKALLNNTTGQCNTANGYAALIRNTTGVNNTALGRGALYYNTTGNSNTAIGNHSLFKNNTGNFNTACGDSSLLNNTEGLYNTAIGYAALLYNTVGDSNTAIGAWSMRINTTGKRNTATGALTMWRNTTGNFNTATGYGALFHNYSGGANTATGYLSLNFNNGGGNTANGYYALYNNYSGNYNTAVGCRAYYAGNTYSYTNFSNSTALGYYAPIDSSNKIRFGNTSVTSIGGEVGWTTYSDARIKTNIQENVPGLDFIKQLRPVTYYYDIDKQNKILGIHDTATWEGKDDIKSMRFTGFIAQEVDAAAKKLGYEFSGVDKNGKLWGLRYAEFTVPLVKAVQELNAEKEKQQKIIDELKLQNADLQSTVNNLQLTVEKQQKIIDKLKLQNNLQIQNLKAEIEKMQKQLGLEEKAEK